MMPVALYVTPNYIASVRRGRRARESCGGTVRFVGVDALPFDIEHLCLLDCDTADRNTVRCGAGCRAVVC